MTPSHGPVCCHRGFQGLGFQRYTRSRSLNFFVNTGDPPPNVVLVGGAVDNCVLRQESSCATFPDHVSRPRLASDDDSVYLRYPERPRFLTPPGWCCTTVGDSENNRRKATMQSRLNDERCNNGHVSTEHLVVRYAVGCHRAPDDMTWLTLRTQHGISARGATETKSVRVQGFAASSMIRHPNTLI